MIKEIKDWKLIFGQDSNHGIYGIGNNIFLIINNNFYNDLKENYTLEDLSMDDLLRQEIVIFQDGEVISCTKVKDFEKDCKTCKHLNNCAYCIGIKLSN